MKKAFIHTQTNKRIFVVLFTGLFASASIVTVSAVAGIDRIQQTPFVTSEVCSRDAFTESRHASEDGTGAHIDTAETETLAKLLWGEARGVASETQQSAVVWCVLNRVDSGDPYYPSDVVSVVEQEGQFHGYDVSYPVTDELYALAKDVLLRWHAEKDGAENVGRTLPKEYLWFTGDGETNTFTDGWCGGNVWDWSLSSPYGD